MTFGFGQHHIDITKQFCSLLGEEVLAATTEDKLYNIAKERAAQLGTFKDKGWPIATIRKCHIYYFYPSVDESARILTIEGIYSHIRDDHPMSPDGYACMDLNWNITIYEDNIWGKRVYISV